jgi:D-serine deaminase-like pyridoxal phosphate-dependent protein
VRVAELPTPALVVDGPALDRNLATMAAARPGAALRPHVKAHKCTALAARQRDAGHRTFTCATAHEALGMAAAGLGYDLLVANEVVDPRRLRALAAAVAGGARVTVAVDSDETVDAAVAAGLAEVLVDVDVGLPRCGCDPAAAGRLADRARAGGLVVRGVMGYEGHLMMVTDRAERAARVAAAMDLLLAAHADVGGDVVSAGGTGTYDLHDRVSEVQAGSYALMDSHYGGLGLPFEQALHVVATVVAVRSRWAVADAGLKAFGMDHGNPSLAGDGGTVWFCSDEHTTYAPAEARRPRVGDRTLLVPAHVDPTVAYHERLWVADGAGLDAEVIDEWPVDLRGWG